MKIIILAGGCFWGVEKFFSLIKGVIDTDAVYVNGITNNPTYEDICNNDTRYAEGVRIEYDNSLISLGELLEFYYQIINPTSLNKQGNDVGTQYRTGIYFFDKEDEYIITNSLAKVQLLYEDKIVIEVAPVENYTIAEEEHQNYLDKNPNGYCHIGNDKFKIAKNTQEK